MENDLIERLKRMVATVRLTDGDTVTLMETIGVLGAQTKKITKLEDQIIDAEIEIALIKQDI